MSAREVGRIWMDGHVEMNEKVYADMAHRDDLARTAARAWIEFREYWPDQVGLGLQAALDRLAAEYGETP